jgi:hypothetical protein
MVVAAPLHVVHAEMLAAASGVPAVTPTDEEAVMANVQRSCKLPAARPKQTAKAESWTGTRRACGCSWPPP